MARTRTTSSSTFQGGFNWRGILGGRRGKRRPGVLRRPAARVEPLEGRQLLSITLVSANSTGQAIGAIEDNQEFAVSDNGQFVVFTSTASAADFGTGATDDGASRDVFLKNLASGAVTLVSGTSGVARGGQMPSISSDGRFVAFTSDFNFASGSAVSDANGSNDVYVLDTQAGTFTPVSVNSSGTAMAGGSIQPSISNNGRVVAFVSTVDAGTVVAGVTDANGTARDVFVRNLDTAATTLISASTAGATTTGNARSEEPALNADGTVVAFMSQATDLSAVPDGSAATNDIFRRAVAGTTTDLVSVGTVSGSPGAVGGTAVSISGDGNLVAFSSSSSAIVPGDTNSSTDVFIRNMTQGTTQLVSTTQAGELGQGNSINPWISDNGTFIVFQTAAANLVAPGTNATGNDIVVKNLADGSLTRVSQTDAGEPASAGGAGVNSSFPEINADGTAVAFMSLGTNLAPGTEDAAASTPDLFAWKSANVVPGDTTVPTAIISAQPVTAAGGTSHTITVTYNDNAAVDVSSIGVDDITVTGPGGATTPLVVTAATATPNTNAATVVVDYAVTPPGGTWDAADNGTYTVALAAGAVRDTSGNGVAAGNGTFAVNTSGGGTGGPGPDLVGAIAPKPALPSAVIGGQKGRARLVLTNQGDTPVAQPVSFQIQAVPTGSTTGSPVDVTTVTRPIRLKAGRSRSVPLKFVYPAVPDGTYNLVVNVDSTGGLAEGNEANNTATSAAPVTIAAPFVDLTAAVGTPTRGSFTIGRRTSVPITITNSGNVPATGTITIDLFASADNLIDAGDLPLASVTKTIKLRNGRSRPVRVSFVVPSNLAAGSYFVTTAIDTQNAIAESNETNNTAVSSTAFQAA